MFLRDLFVAIISDWKIQSDTFAFKDRKECHDVQGPIILIKRIPIQ